MAQHPAFKKLRAERFSLWRALTDLRDSPEHRGLLARWREAEAGSVESRYAFFYDQAVDFLQAETGVSRDQAKRAVQRYADGKQV